MVSTGGEDPVADVWETFVRMVESRFAAGVHTAERTIVFLMALALRDDGHNANDLALEVPYPVAVRDCLDLVVYRSGSTVSSLEFKYDRAGPSGSTQPRPAKAGSALGDIRRLSTLPDHHRWFVHTVDQEMASYLERPSNGLNALYGGHQGAQTSVGSDLLAPLSDTLRRHAGPWTEEVSCQLMHRTRLPRGHALYAFRLKGE